MERPCSVNSNAPSPLGGITWGIFARASSRPGRCALQAQQILRVASHPVGKTKLHITDLGRAGEVCSCRFRKRGSPSHCGLETKAFQRCPLAPMPRPLRPTSRQPRRSGCGPGIQHTASSLFAAPRADSGSRGCARTCHSRGHPHAAPFPQCNSPPSGGLAGLWRTPKCAPHLGNSPSPPASS